VTHGSFWSVTRYVAWRNVKIMFRNPALVLPAILLPVFFLVAFVGSVSAVDKTGKFQTPDYAGFQYVFALCQAAAFTGAMGGFALAEDWETGFMSRLFVTSRKRSAILVGYCVALLVRVAVPVIVLTGVAFILRMGVDGSPLQMLGLYVLVGLLSLCALLWAAGLAMRTRSMKAAQWMVLPIFLLLFLAPVFVPLVLLHGWLHGVATANPLTRILESGRGFLGGHYIDVPYAFLVAGGGFVILAIWAFLGVRKAEKAGI
jgi:ABC-2 type transport system permease protein